MRNIIEEFKDFLFRGNLIDLAVALVIGLAFVALVDAFVAGLITPIIAAVAGKADFSSLAFTINGSRFAYGSVINALITFFFVAAAIFFFVVKPVNMMMSRRKADPAAAVRDCPECLSEIPAAASRCSFCTAKISPSPFASEGAQA